MRNFRNLNIWKQGIDLASKIYQISNDLPIDEKYGFKSQICRASVSVPSNIAEGCSRSSDIEYKRFLEIALGSLFELETQMIIIQELNFIANEKITPIIDLIHIEQKMINSLITKIKGSIKKPIANSQ